MVEIIFIPPISLLHLSRHCTHIRRVDGGIWERFGREMGEMTGEMKKAKSLYLKAFSPSDRRDGNDFVNTLRRYLPITHAYFSIMLPYCKRLRFSAL